MRDEMDGRIWTAHHDSLSRAVDDGAAMLRSLRRNAPGAAKQIIAAAAAFGMTFLTLGGSVA